MSDNWLYKINYNGIWAPGEIELPYPILNGYGWLH